MEDSHIIAGAGSRRKRNRFPTIPAAVKSSLYIYKFHVASHIYASVDIIRSVPALCFPSENNTAAIATVAGDMGLIGNCLFFLL